MDTERQLNKICKQIENDPNMSGEEKHEAILAEEDAARDWEEQRQAEHNEIDRQYGY